MPRTANKTIIFMLLILLLTVAELNSSIFVPAMPTMMESLHAPMSAIQHMVVISMVTFGLALLVWGPLADRIGRRFVVLAGLGLYFVGSVLICSVASVPWLMAGRALQGLGISCAGAILPVIPKDIFSGAALSRAFSVISMAFAIMPMVAQILGGYLQTFYGWQSTFVFLCIYSVIAWIVLYRFLPETRTVAPSRHPLMVQYWEILRDSTFLGYLACMSFVFAGEMAYTLVAPFLLQQDLKISAIFHGWLSLATGGGLLAGALLSARLAAFRQTHQLVGLGIGICTAATLWMAGAFFAHWLSVFVVVAPMVLFMVGAGLVYPNCIAGIMNRFPEKAGVAGALMSSGQMAGTGIFAAVMTEMHIQGQHDLLVAFAAVVGLTIMAYRGLVLKSKGIGAPERI